MHKFVYDCCSRKEFVRFLIDIDALPIESKRMRHHAQFFCKCCKSLVFYGIHIINIRIFNRVISGFIQRFKIRRVFKVIRCLIDFPGIFCLFFNRNNNSGTGTCRRLQYLLVIDINRTVFVHVCCISAQKTPYHFEVRIAHFFIRDTIVVHHP